MQPPAETSGTQVGTCKINAAGTCVPYSLTDYYNQSAQQATQGGAANNVGEIAFDLNGRYNGRSDFWNMPKNNIGPRIALAYSPDAKEGFWNKIFGDRKSSIRAGYSLVYDHFGAATVNTFDTTGSFGLSTNLSNAPGTVDIATAPRFTNIYTIPDGLLPAAPPGGFPAVPSPTQFAISWGLDSKIKTPYSHLIDFRSNASWEMGRPSNFLMWVGLGIVYWSRKTWPCRSISLAPGPPTLVRRRKWPSWRVRRGG